jgi:hypothetical protein
MNAAQKAWATRRANGWQPKGEATAKHRKHLLDTTTPKPAEPDWRNPKPVIAVDRDAMNPVAEFEFVEFWVDDADVGCGQFRFLVLDRGAHKVRLFYLSRLATIVVDRKKFDDNHTPARRVNRTTLADIIRRNVAMADRVNDGAQRPVLSDGGTFAVRALELITGEARQ